jgi:CBS domain-containing membrane protein
MGKCLQGGVNANAPLLAGGNFRDNLVAALGGLVGIAVTGAVCRLVGYAWHDIPFLVAPMGASAVLLFAVPASPLAQPWSIVGGNVLSAFVGVTAARTIHEPSLAAGAAVGGAILVMSALRCLHPPGGAAALTAVVGGPTVAAAGFAFPLVPVGLDAAVLVATGLLFHRFSGHTYPHYPRLANSSAPHVQRGLHREDIHRAVADFGETLDVSPEDLDLILERAEQHAIGRRTGDAER